MLNDRRSSFKTGNPLRGLPVFVLLALLLLTASPGMARTPDLSTEQLRAAGVTNFDNFQPLQFGPDGKTVYFWEETRPEKRPAGVFANLWEFRFRSDGAPAGSRCFPLKMPRPLQMHLTPDHKGVVLLAREGASFWHLDLASGALREFVTPALGQTRFKSDPLTLWVDQGKMWTSGYTLSPELLRGPHTLAEIRPDKTGADALVIAKDLDLDQLLGYFHPKQVQSWVNPDLGWAGGLVDGVMEMAVWQRATGWTSLGRFKDVTSAWKSGPYQILTGVGQDGKSKAVIFDAETKKRWELPETQGTYDYPFISQGGGTVLLVDGPREAARMKILYAHQADGYKPQVLPGFENVQKGYMRLAPDGQHAVYRNETGVFFLQIPR